MRVCTLHCSSKEAIETAHAQFREVIADILAPHAAALEASGITVPALADLVQRASKAAGLNARDRDHLFTQLATLRQLCLAAAGQPDGH